MSQAAFPDPPDLPSEVIALGRQLKAVLNAGLHKRRIKPDTRNAIEAVCYFYPEINPAPVLRQKGKTRATKSLEDSHEQFPSEWAVDPSCITGAAKTLITQTDDFRNSLAFKAFLYKENHSPSTGNTPGRNTPEDDQDDLPSDAAKILVREPPLTSTNEQDQGAPQREDSLSRIPIEDNIVELSTIEPPNSSESKSTSLNDLPSIQGQNESTPEPLSKKADSSGLSSPPTLADPGAIPPETTDQGQKTDITEELQASSTQTSFADHRLIHQTPSRVLQLSRVQSIEHAHTFRSPDLKEIRDLLATRPSPPSTSTPPRAPSRVNTEATLPGEYPANSSPTVLRQCNYQPLQGLIQRNFDFLGSILPRSTKLQPELVTRELAESSAAQTSQNLPTSANSHSDPPGPETNQERDPQDDTTVETTRRERAPLNFLTTPLRPKQPNPFLPSPVLPFDPLLHQFRSSFFSDSSTSSAKSVPSSRLPARFDPDSPRIQELEESHHPSPNFSSEHSRSTDITPAMSTPEGNAPPPPASNLTQQDIQGIALSMFNLFAQNVQSQAQARTEATNDAVVTMTKKSSFRASDVGFFDPQLNPFYDSDDVIQMRRDLYYRDVYLFVERVKNAVIMSGAEAVRTNLSACLRGSAQV
jgi:hypothetical protein